MCNNECSRKSICTRNGQVLRSRLVFTMDGPTNIGKELNTHLFKRTPQAGYCGEEGGIDL